MQRRQLLGLGIAGAAAAHLGVGRSLWAQEKYPQRPIRLLVGFSAGGPTDIVARKYADRMGRILGQQLVVDNKPGASAVIASVDLVKSKPDGYTLMMITSSSHGIAPNSMVVPRYDAAKDFTYVTVVGVVPMVMAVHPDLPAKTLPEAVALFKANPGKYSYGSSGVGGIAHLAAELFLMQAGGLKVEHIPYKGAGPGIQDTVGGHVQMFFDTFSTTLPHHRAGTLRILASFGEQRSKAAPEIPTAVESGVAGAVAYTFNAIVAPAGTPRNVVDTIAEATKQAMADEAFRADLESVGVEPTPDSSPEKATAFVAAEIAKWAPVVKATGVKME
jgi:tripartite-type tricarboxylate transporter receptor subunit TctC